MEHDHLNKLSITFQQKDQCEIWWKLAKWFLKNHDFIHVNSTVAGKYYKYKSDDGYLRFPNRTILLHLGRSALGRRIHDISSYELLADLFLLYFNIGPNNNNTKT